MLTDAERTNLDDLVERQARDLEWLAKVRAHYPLAVSALWTAGRPSTGWDQRMSVEEAMRARSVTLVKGGWRSGKSEGCKQLTVAMALGGDHPMVQRWLELNDLPRDVIPDGPAQVYAIAPSSNDSIRFHRDDFDRLTGSIPKRWLNRNAKGEALLELQVPGYVQRAKIWFKSVDQTRKAFQGISIRWWWIDEEPLGEVGHGVYDELRARVADQGGRGAISMVPMEGLTWVFERLERDGEDEARVVELDALDNPHLPASFRQIYQGMSDDEVQVRRFGRFKSRSGAVYAFVTGNGERWGPGHLCEPFEIPADWPRFRGADFGLVNPTCVLWGALGDDDTLYIYREHYEGGPSFAEHARAVRELEAGEVVEAGWGDPSAREAIEDWALEDIYLDKANNDVRAGIDAVKERMRIRGDERPRLKIFRPTHGHPGCPNLIRELQGYVWDPMRKDEVPVKKHDHAPDALRYMVMGIREWRGL